MSPCNNCTYSRNSRHLKRIKCETLLVYKYCFNSSYFARIIVAWMRGYIWFQIKSVSISIVSKKIAQLHNFFFTQYRFLLLRSIPNLEFFPQHVSKKSHQCHPSRHWDTLFSTHVYVFECGKLYQNRPELSIAAYVTKWTFRIRPRTVRTKPSKRQMTNKTNAGRVRKYKPPKKLCSR